MSEMIRTATGDIDAETIGLCLPHEHIYTDLRPLAGRVEAVPDEAEVLAANVPLLVEAREPVSACSWSALHRASAGSLALPARVGAERRGRGRLHRPVQGAAATGVRL